MENTTIKSIRNLKKLTIGISTTAVIVTVLLTIAFAILAFKSTADGSGVFTALGYSKADMLRANPDKVTDGGLTAIAAGIAAIGFVGAGIGQGYAAGKAAEAVGRNPEAEGQIRNMMFVGAAVAESSALYALVISIMCLFVA